MCQFVRVLCLSSRSNVYYYLSHMINIEIGIYGIDTKEDRKPGSLSSPSHECSRLVLDIFSLDKMRLLAKVEINSIKYTLCFR